MKYTGQCWLNEEESYLKGENPENTRGAGFGEVFGGKENMSTTSATASMMLFIHTGTFNCLF